MKLAAVQLTLLAVVASSAAAPAAYAFPLVSRLGGPELFAKGHSIQSTTGQSDISGGSLPTPATDNSTIKNALEIVFGIIGAFAVLNITLSGLKYITAAGDAQKTSEAKNGIVYSLVGLAIAISAEAIVAFLVTWGTKTT